MGIQEEKSAEAQLGSVIFTTFLVGAVIGGGLVFAFRVSQEDYWRFRAQNAESQVENAQRRAQEAETKYNALITGAAITK